MPLRFERPSTEYMRELKAVARSAAALRDHFPKINRLPDDFPEEQVKGFCNALVRLPDGTAEGSIAPLRAADSELNRIRQRFIPAHSDDENDEEPFLARDGDLDLRLVSLMAAVRSAIERYKVEAGEELDTDVTPDLAVTLDIEVPRQQALEAVAKADSKVADAEKAFQKIADLLVREKLDADERLVKDAGTQVKSTESALATRSPRPTVLEWLDDSIHETAIELERRWDKVSGKAKAAGIEVADGAVEFVELFVPITAALRVVITRTKNIISILKSENPSAIDSGEDSPDFSYVETYNRLLRGEAIPQSWIPFITKLNFDSVGQHHLGEGERSKVTGDAARFSNTNLLAALTSLIDLSLNNTQVADIAPLAALTSLRNLGLHNTKVENIAPLAALTNLTALWLSNTPVADVSALAALSNLEGLYLSTTKVADVSALAALNNLTGLWLDNTQVANVSALATLTKLTGLSLENTQVADIAPLAALTNLVDLWLEHTEVSDLSPLKQIKGLNIHR